MAQKKWTEISVNPSRVLLDVQNPRIEVAGDATQDDLRQKLLAHEDVVKLATKIVTFGGLLPGERIIVCKENDKYVVVEGNRRVCACQLLLKPALVPEKYKKRFPVASQELKDAIAKIGADVAPNRDAAEPTITKRHTEPGIEKWRTTAKMRRASRLLDQGYDLEQIAEKLGARQSVLRTSIREYRLLRYVLDFDYHAWNQDELARLTDQTLQTNPFTRFFGLAGVRDKLGLSFDEHDHITTSLESGVFNQYMHHIARCFFIPVAPHKKPWANTRATAEEVLSKFTPVANSPLGASVQGRKEESQSREPGSRPTPEATGAKQSGADANPPTPPKQAAPKSAKASVFFEKLVCSVDDDRLLALTKEIKSIDHTDYPIAAAMLLRALFESALTFQVKKAGKSAALNKGKNGKDMGLNDLLNYCANRQNEIFSHGRIYDLLAAFKGPALKDYLDLIVHGRWIEASSSALETVASSLRPLIKTIVEGVDTDLESNNV